MWRLPKVAIAMVLSLGLAICLVVPITAQTCEPLYNGRLADTFYEGTAIFWEPVVEYRQMVLTIGGPCEDIVKVYGPKDQISFDLAEIQRVGDGTYTWELHRVSAIDEGIQAELTAARGSGEADALWWRYFQEGAIPQGPYVDSGSFTVVGGQILDPNLGSEKSAPLASAVFGGPASVGAQVSYDGEAVPQVASEGSGGNTLATKDTVLTNANGVIRNSLCVGFDCANSNTYSDTTILLRENNTRIKFDDTSTLNSFPRNDWEIEANSNLNGGASYLGFNDCGQSSQGGCATDLVFAVEAGVRQNALYVESDGDVGFGTSNPVVRLHTTDGDTPALRLEQDGSSGFAPQTWDVAGNETSFFVRDATNGSTLPFRIFPNSPSNALVIKNGNVGVGSLNPSDDLCVDVAGGNGGVSIVSDTNLPQLTIDNQAVASSDGKWRFRVNGVGNFVFTHADTNSTSPFVAEPEANTNLLVLSGDAVKVTGRVEVNGLQVHPDYVFEPDYELESIEEHSKYMWAEKHLPAIGAGTYQEDGRSTVDLVGHQFGIVEELEKAHIYIEQLHETVRGLEDELVQRDSRLALLEERLARLEEGQPADE